MEQSEDIPDKGTIGLSIFAKDSTESFSQRLQQRKCQHLLAKEMKEKHLQLKYFHKDKVC